MTTQPADRPTARYTLTCPSWCAVDHHQPGDPGVHELCFPVPGLDDGEATVVLCQSATEAAAIDVYLPRAGLSVRQALDLAEALAHAAEALLPARRAPRQVDVVQVLPDLVALRQAVGGLCVIDAEVLGTDRSGAPPRAHLVLGGHGLVLYAFGNPEHVVLPAAEAAIEHQEAAPWEWSEGEWRVELPVGDPEVR